VTIRNSALSLPNDSPGRTIRPTLSPPPEPKMWESMKKPLATASAKAKVARARYRSRSRMVGRATSAPTTAQMAVAATRPSSEPPPATLPITNAPMPMKENWHRETWPE
jgi:hypothetical protein